MKKTLITLSLIGTLFLSACGASTTSMGMSDSSLSSVPATGDMMVENKVSIDRSIIKTSSLTVRVKNVEKSITQAQDLETEFEDRLIRIHRNALASTNYITGMEKNIDGRFVVSFKEIQDKLEISRRHVAEVRKFLKFR